MTVRDSEIETLDGGQGGDGGEPERGGRGGRGAPGGVLEDRSACSCNGGPGGDGGPGRGGDAIGIATLDEDRLTAEGVTFTLGPPGKGGIRWDDQGKMVSGEDGVALETLRFAE